tara:strand:- start:2508 stop:3740 length:1233 start_codon:yes stop_codon:yes gene_type:complete
LKHIKLSLIFIIIFTNSLTTEANTFDINLTSDLKMSSNHLKFSEIDKLLSGIKLSENFKNNFIDNTYKENKHNIDFKNYLELTYLNSKYKINLSFTDRIYTSYNVKKDFFEFIFFGNSRSISDTLNFNESYFSALKYQQIKLGSTHNFKNYQIGYKIGYLIGNNLISTNIENATLYTSQNITNILMDYNVSSTYSNEFSSSFFRRNGNGISVDLNFSKKTESKSYKIQILNFGFIKWLDNNNNYSDSNFIYSGIEITDDINISDSNFFSKTSLDKFSSESKTYSFLPTQISFFIDTESKIQFIRSNKIGFNFLWYPTKFYEQISDIKFKDGLNKNGFAPQIYTESIFNLNYFLFSPIVSYGGFSNNLNVGIKLSFGKSNNFCIGSYNLESLLQQRESNNVSIYLQLKLSL